MAENEKLVWKNLFRRNKGTKLGEDEEYNRTRTGEKIEIDRNERPRRPQGKEENIGINVEGRNINLEAFGTAVIFGTHLQTWGQERDEKKDRCVAQSTEEGRGKCLTLRFESLDKKDRKKGVRKHRRHIS